MSKLNFAELVNNIANATYKPELQDLYNRGLIPDEYKDLIKTYKLDETPQKDGQL